MHSTSNKGRMLLFLLCTIVVGSVFVAFCLNGSKVAADPASGKKIAFVKPIFTQAAYNNAFYNFYHRYDRAPKRAHITTDLQMLTATIPSEDNAVPNKTALDVGVPFFSHHTASTFPHATISTITDADVNSGAIFTAEGANAYDVLVFFHEEYATQQEYDNLKTFTSQGGVVVFLDGNIFYAEVSYSATAQKVTLVKGHGWDHHIIGNYAVKSADERWPAENTQYFGALYYDAYEHTYSNGTFIYQYQNDPFNYGPVRLEDSMVTNPDHYVIMDYKINQPGKSVETYWRPYGDGRVIVFGIYAERVRNNPMFLDFYDHVLADYAFRHPRIS